MAASRATNKLTDIILGKVGYKVVKSIDCAEIRVNGKQVLDLEAMGDSTIIRIMVKDLKEDKKW